MVNETSNRASRCIKDHLLIKIHQLGEICVQVEESEAFISKSCNKETAQKPAMETLVQAYTWYWAANCASLLPVNAMDESGAISKLA